MIVLELTKKKTNMNKMSEFEFGADFIDTGAISHLYPTGGVLTELETIHGIPDAVLILARDVNYLKELHHRFSDVYLTSGHARVMSSLYSRRLQDVDVIADKSGLSRNYTNSILKSLVTSELVFHDDGKYRLPDEYSIPRVGIVSIEFKLTDWKKALTQAFRHTTFASKSYVVMPSNKKRVLEKNRELFKAYGVSVATYDTTSKKLEKIIDVRPKHHSRVSYVDSLFKVVNNYDRVQLRCDLCQRAEDGTFTSHNDDCTSSLNRGSGVVLAT